MKRLRKTFIRIFSCLIIAIAFADQHRHADEYAELGTCWSKAIELAKKHSGDVNPAVQEYSCTEWLPAMDKRAFHCVVLQEEPWLETRDGEQILHGPIHGRRVWRVLLDCHSKRAYEIDGFEGHEFNEFMASLGRKNLTVDEASSVARFYMDVRFPRERQVVVTDVFEVEQAVGGYLHRRLGPRETSEHRDAWMAGLPASARDTLGAPGLLTQTDRDYWIRLFVVRNRVQRSQAPIVELRELHLAIDRSGRVVEQEDLLLHPVPEKPLSSGK